MSLVSKSPSPRSALAAVFLRLKQAFIALIVFSAAINLLMLTGPLFMMEIYDRVLPSRSIPTLVGLVIIAAAMFLFQGGLDFVRSRLVIRVAAALDEKLAEPVFEIVRRMPLETRSGDGIQPLRDLDNLRVFISGAGPIALFDLPWLPVYLAICFLLHTAIGLTALFGALVLIALSILTEIRTRQAIQTSGNSGIARLRMMESVRRNAESILALGMAAGLRQRWRQINAEHLSHHGVASDAAGSAASVIKVLRLMLQSAVLAVGAYLVIRQEATGGVIIAGSIIAARALAPVDVAVANWKQFVTARESWERLARALPAPGTERPRTELPRPTQDLRVQTASVSPPGSTRAVVQDVNFTLKAGDGLGIIGPSASGKSSLGRMLVGIWRPMRGTVRLDGASLDQWQEDALGQHVGYLPQDIELIEGTVADNIARFRANPNPEDIIAAAIAAGVHEMILSLPEGYETKVGEGAGSLSAGQRQRIALARALFGAPFLVVLDEPNSNLDAEGDAALTAAIRSTRARGAIVVVIAHRPSALAAVDYVLAMANSRQQTFGPKEEVLAKVLHRASTSVRAM